MKETGKETIESIRTKPGSANNGKPFDHVVQEKVAKGEDRLQCVSVDVLGTRRPI